MMHLIKNLIIFIIFMLASAFMLMFYFNSKTETKDVISPIIIQEELE